MKAIRATDKHIYLDTISWWSYGFHTLVLSSCLLLGSCQVEQLATAHSVQKSGQYHSTLFGANSSELETSVADSLAPTKLFPETDSKIASNVKASLEQVDRNDSFWHSLRDQFELDHHLDTPQVQAQLRWLQTHPDYLLRLEDALQAHLPYVLDQVTKAGIPAELALVPIIESAYDPYAFSPGGALGFWQFMPATAERFGLERNWWYEGRRDIVASTQAATEYFQFLHSRFDDWLLVLAGYNAGEGKVRRAIARFEKKSANKDPDLFELPLPGETLDYVPRLLAFAAIIDNPSTYKVKLPTMVPEALFHSIDTTGQFDIAKAAEVLELKTEELFEWNPALNRWATPPEGPHRLLIPTHAGTSEFIQEKINQIPQQERIAWKPIEVAPGDTLGKIAKEHNTDTQALITSNALKNNVIRVGQRLFVPRSGASVVNPRLQSRQLGKVVKVEPGDSLWKLGRRYNISVKKLRAINQLAATATIKVGQKIRISKGNSAATRRVRYSVRSGDSLDRIASRFQVSAAAIADWNNIDEPDSIRPGQPITLYIDPTGAE